MEADRELESVIERTQRGDGEALAEIYRRFGRRVFGLCLYLLGEREAAEDATSEVFLRVRRAAASYDRASPFQHWLSGVASHYCVDLLRRRRRERQRFAAEPVVQEPAAAALSPLEEALAEERRSQVREAILKLPDRYRTLLVLRYYDESSYDEIARQLGMERSHVGTLIYRAKQELRRALARERR